MLRCRAGVLKSNQQYFALNSNSEYFIHLIRVVAAQGVVMGHGASFFGVFPYIQPPNFFYIQNIGVVLFFFISGFVISYTCYRKNIVQQYTFLHFLFDRSFRLLLVLAPVALLVFGVDLYFCNVPSVGCEYQKSLSIFNYFGNILFLQDYPVLKFTPTIGVTSLPITMIGTGRPFWSLAIEFWLYIFFGYVVLKKSVVPGYKILSFLFFFFSLPVVVLNCFGGKGNGLALLWFFGVFAMQYFKNNQEMLSQKLAICCILFLAVFSFYRNNVWNYTEYNFEANIIICAILFLLIVSIHNWKYLIFNMQARRIIMFFANYSFTLYASHYTVLYWIEKNFADTNNKMLLFMAGFFLSNIIAIGLAFCCEMKYKQLRLKMKNCLTNFLSKHQKRSYQGY